MQTPTAIPAIAPLEVELGEEPTGTALGELPTELKGAALPTIVVEKTGIPVEEGAAGGLVTVAEVAADGGFVNKAVAALGKTRLASAWTRVQNAAAEVF